MQVVQYRKSDFFLICAAYLDRIERFEITVLVTFSEGEFF